MRRATRIRLRTCKLVETLARCWVCHASDQRRINLLMRTSGFHPVLTWMRSSGTQLPNQTRHATSTAVVSTDTALTSSGRRAASLIASWARCACMGGWRGARYPIGPAARRLEIVARNLPLIEDLLVLWATRVAAREYAREALSRSAETSGPDAWEGGTLFRVHGRMSEQHARGIEKRLFRATHGPSIVGEGQIHARYKRHAQRKPNGVFRLGRARGWKGDRQATPQ